ncbi:hypothetical protein DL96DRAFT_1614707 [Flagelloscypha sp. PMI_526]|nr:hypothetical protein DL96DRAFT_1614707 [Flagelloscypha sp. PMI_526]
MLLSIILLSACVAIVWADAGTELNPHNNEGENHSELNPPNGSRLKDIPIQGGTNNEVVTVFWSDPMDEQRDEATHVYVMIHGKLRDGDAYWDTLHSVFESAIHDKVPGADRKAYLIAPQFFSTRYNSGAFNDTNGWQAGDRATHPEDTTLTSIDALDSIIAELRIEHTLPWVAMFPMDYHVRYIVGDASTHAYFTEQRPVTVVRPSNFGGTAHDGGRKDTKEYFARYMSRDVVLIVAQDDTDNGGDQFCPAQMQGGIRRRDRNLAWWTYIQTLARSSEPVQLFNVGGNLTGIPDWSDVMPSRESGIGPRLLVLKDVTHNSTEVFGSEDGRRTLFQGFGMPLGWRPAGYNNTKADCSYC